MSSEMRNYGQKERSCKQVFCKVKYILHLGFF
jgi:hypothetical protein